MTTENEIVRLLSRVDEPPASIARGVLTRTALADEYVLLPGPIGEIHVAFTPLGVSAIVPTANESEFLEVHSRTVGRKAFRSDELPGSLGRQLERTLDTGRLGKLPVDLRQLTGFQRDVLKVTATIPPGEVRPYGWVARELGNDGAVRAVGSALGRNPVPIAIPCHRVVKSDGTIGNYAFGSPMKRSLLEHEGMVEFGTVQYTGSDTTRIYCFATCRHARRTADAHRVEFRTPQRAVAAGYRACKVCRPG
jgi:methylated-DNA-[protein]-cysteine S-methyltransferase